MVPLLSVVFYDGSCSCHNESSCALTGFYDYSSARNPVKSLFNITTDEVNEKIWFLWKIDLRESHAQFPASEHYHQHRISQQHALRILCSHFTHTLNIFAPVCSTLVICFHSPIACPAEVYEISKWMDTFQIGTSNQRTLQCQRL